MGKDRDDLDALRPLEAVPASFSSGSVGVRLHPSGDQCLVVQFGEGVDVDVNRRACAFAQRIDAARWPFITDVVPSFTGVGIHYRAERVPVHAGESPLATVARLVRESLAQPLVVAGDGARQIEIPVCYGGDHGPDFEEVAAAAGVSPAELVALHAGIDAHVFMIGFAPGTPYLGLWDSRLAIPRRKTPRTRVAAGTVAIANRQTVIYAYDLPGGWNLIGRTPLAMFDPGRPQPGLLRAGDCVRFVPVSADDFERLRTVGARGGPT